MPHVQFAMTSMLTPGLPAHDTILAVALRGPLHKVMGCMLHLHVSEATACVLSLYFALQLKLGWKTWRQLGSRKFDINLRFRSTNIFRLQLLIDPQDPVQLKVGSSSHRHARGTACSCTSERRCSHIQSAMHAS